MRIRLSLLGWLALGLALFYAFFLWRFPYEPLRKAVVQNFEERFPLALSVGRAGPLFPAGLRMENIRVSSDSLSFRLPDLNFTPNLAGFFPGRIDLSIGSGPASRLEGRIRQDKERSRLELRLNQVEVLASAPGEFSFPLRLSGDMSVEWAGDDWSKGSGTVWALAARGEVVGDKVSRAPFPLTLFDTLRAEAQLKDGVIRLKRLEASGKDTKFSLPSALQFPAKGGIPPELAFILQAPRR